MLRALVFVAVAALFAANSAAAAEESCAVLVQTGDGVQVQAAPGWTVQGVSPPVLPAGIDNIVAAMCDRDSIVPDVSDFRVVTDLLLPFNIRSGGRIIVLEISNGQLRARFLRGALTEAERAALQAAMNDAQIIAQREPAQGMKR